MPKGLQGFQKGSLNPSKTKESRERARRLKLGKKLSKDIVNKIVESRKGYKHSEETKKKMSISAFFSKIGKTGENANNWQGGKTRLTALIRGNYKYRQWRSDVFTRDGFTCQICGDKTGGNLNADHIKPQSVIISEYKLKTIEQAVDCEELWDINNGKTLCETCHSKTDTFGVKALKFLNHTR